jgi:hypothetical protein
VQQSASPKSGKRSHFIPEYLVIIVELARLLTIYGNARIAVYR